MYDNYFFCELTANYLDQAAHLLNTEWPRSVSQRHLSLQNFMSNDLHFNPCSDESHEFKLPISLLLVDQLEDKVIGHASLLQIAVKQNDGQIENLAFLQSLIVDKNLRGKGLGKKMMSYCELYLCKYAQQQAKLNSSNLDELIRCDYLYLTTKDKQLFYEAIGYEPTEPLLFYSVKNAHSKCNRIMNNLLNSFKTNDTNILSRTPIVTNSNEKVDTQITLATPPPPAPPPPPIFQKQTNEIIDKKKDNSYIVAESSWYKKQMKLKAF